MTQVQKQLKDNIIKQIIQLKKQQPKDKSTINKLQLLNKLVDVVFEHQSFEQTAVIDKVYAIDEMDNTNDMGYSDVFLAIDCETDDPTYWQKVTLQGEQVNLYTRDIIIKLK